MPGNVLTNYRPQFVLPSAQQLERAQQRYQELNRGYRQARSLYNRAREYIGGAAVVTPERTRGNSTVLARRRPTGIRNFNATEAYQSLSMPRYNGGGPGRGVNRVKRFKRRGRRRRRMRFGTKVRKQALGLFEGRVNVIANTYLTGAPIPARTMGKVALMTELSNPATLVNAVQTGADSSTQDLFSGRSIFVRGFKINMFVVNNSTENPVDVRIICGWRKINANETIVISDIGTTPEFSIFKNTTTNQGMRTLAETAHGDAAGFSGTNDPYLLGRAPIDKKAFHCEKDFMFRLGPSAIAQEQVFGSNTKRISFWWDLKNKKWSVKNTVSPTATVLEKEQLANWWPVVYFYHITPLAATTGAAGDCAYRMSHKIYWKDPLG